VLRHNHYERAFEACLRERALPYVAVDETKKALFSGSRLKSFDFVVYSRSGPNLLVDVKGRRAVNGSALQTWATRRDVDDLHQWERVFGDDFMGLLAFVFEVDPILAGPPGHFAHRQGVQADERHYLMLALRLRDYRDHMSRRSARWDTVSLPAARFRELARPIEGWL